MKQLVIFLVSILLLWGGLGWAGDRCPLTGHTYSFEIDEDTRFELSGFECTFGPGCEATCDLWHGDFQTGPLYHVQLPFSCKQDGSAIIAGLPCFVDAHGNLKCLLVDVSGYYCTKLGEVTWCFPEKADTLKFIKEGVQ